MACQQMKLQRAKIFSQRKLRSFVKEVSGKLWPIEDRKTDSDCVRPGPEQEQMWAKTNRFALNLISLGGLFQLFGPDINRCMCREAGRSWLLYQVMVVKCTFYRLTN